MRARIDLQLAVFGASLIALAVLFACTGIPTWIPSAPLLWFKIASPLSGMTRSFVALARGDLAGSFRWHPLGPLAFAACVVAVVAPFAPSLRHALVRAAPPGRRRRIVIAVAIAAIAGAWIRQIMYLG